MIHVSARRAREIVPYFAPPYRLARPSLLPPRVEETLAPLRVKAVRIVPARFPEHLLPCALGRQALIPFVPVPWR